MKIQIDDKDLEDLILTGASGKYWQLARNKQFMDALGRVYRLLEAVQSVKELKLYSFLHYEQLKGIRKSSVRIMNGRVERLVFVEINNGLEIQSLELDRDHYGKKK